MEGASDQPASDPKPEGASPEQAASARSRERVTLALKILVTGGALAWTFTHMHLADLLDAVGRLSIQAVVLATGLTLLNLSVAAVRWHVLLAAYGARDIPKLPFLARAQIVGFFYNQFVPGNVTGDVLRGHATRDCFEGPLGSYMVVALERFFGLAGLASIGAIGLLLHPLPGVVDARWLAAAAFGLSILIALVPVVGRTVGRFLPGRVGRWASNLPAVARPSLLVVVLLLSLLTHTIVGLTGHALIDAIAPQITAAESLVLVPLAMISMYMPLSVAGLGVREAAFVFVFSKVALPRADATASSLAFFAVYSLVAAMGGLAHLARPLNVGAPPKNKN